MDLEGSPGKQGWFGNLALYRVIQLKHGSLIEDRIGKHAILLLHRNKCTYLVSCQLRVHMAVGNGMQSTIPQPQTDVGSLRRRHRFRFYAAPRADEVVPHDPPG